MNGSRRISDLPWTRPATVCCRMCTGRFGLFGYFPTYSLGNVYAGCLHAAMRAALPDLDAQLALGDTGAATDWLQLNVQRHGGLYEPRDVIAQACGAAPSEAPLLAYLEEKFRSIYDL